jgi:hypothetical protein
MKQAIVGVVEIHLTDNHWPDFLVYKAGAFIEVRFSNAGNGFPDGPPSVITMSISFPPVEKSKANA